MYYLKTEFFIAIILVAILACNNKDNTKQKYKTQLKDTLEQTISTKDIDWVNVTPKEVVKDTVITSIPQKKEAIKASKKKKLRTTISTIEQNGKFIKIKEKKAPIEIQNSANNNWQILLSKYVSSNGKINYKGILGEKEFLKDYLVYLSVNVPPSNSSKNTKLAYWMNTYNAFTVELIIDNYPLKSITKLNQPWDTKFIKLGKLHYSLNDIENKKLRVMNDSRIHYGINCASISCPNLSNTAYTASNVNQNLNRLTKQFINDKTKNKFNQARIQISSIYTWFEKDFYTKGTVIDYLNKFADDSLKSGLKIEYLPYNWGLNSQ